MAVPWPIFSPHSHKWTLSQATPFIFLPPTRKKGFKMDLYKEIWFSDRFRIHHVHGSECLREVIMGTVEHHHLAETQKGYSKPFDFFAPMLDNMMLRPFIRKFQVTKLNQSLVFKHSWLPSIVSATSVLPANLFWYMRGFNDGNRRPLQDFYRVSMHSGGKNYKF